MEFQAKAVPRADAPENSLDQTFSTVGSDDTGRTSRRSMIENPKSICDEIRQRDQWVCWKETERGGKDTKIPIEPKTGSFASTDDPETWTSFREALEYSKQSDDIEGVGFVFTEDDPFVGVDLDNCRDENGAFEPWAVQIMETLDSYTEISPSETGAHVLVIGEIPGDRNRDGDVEVYEDDRYFTVTGNLVDDYPETIKENQVGIDAVYAEYLKRSDNQVEPDTSWLEESDVTDEKSESNSDTREGSHDETTSGKSTELTATESRDAQMDDEEVLRVAKNADGDDLFNPLYNGRWKGKYESQSEADMALAVKLAFYTGKNQKQMDRLFRSSGLYRDKWDEVHTGDGRTYGEHTIGKAVNLLDDDQVYDPDYGADGNTSDDHEKSSRSETPTPAESAADAPHGARTTPNRESPSNSKKVEPEIIGSGPSSPQAKQPNSNVDEADRKQRSASGANVDQSTTEGQQLGPVGNGTYSRGVSRTPDWHDQVVDFEGRLPPWVEQMEQRIEELEGEIDRNEQVIRYLRNRTEEYEQEVQQLQKQVETLTRLLQKGGIVDEIDLDQFDQEQELGDVESDEEEGWFFSNLLGD